MDRKNFIENMANEAEKAASEQRMGDVYQITKKLCGQKRNACMPIRDKQGTMITSQKEQEKRWKEHFEEKLNRPDSNSRTEISEADTNFEINTDEPSKLETIATIKSLKNNKAPRNDNLPAEIFKADPTLAADILYPLFYKIWKNSMIPTTWSEGNIVKLPKKKISQTVITGEVLLYFLYQLGFSVK